MPQLMRAADCIITKAGGLIVTESLASGLPMLLVDVTPGQEKGNAEYVVKNGAGEQAIDAVHSLETICHWLEKDGKLLNEYKGRARVLGRPQSAFTAAHLIMAAAERRIVAVPRNRAPVLPKLLELLANSGIST
jgi:UDP-N-acetylglucosamine:LPS N-acetylglucosamine transferase